MAVVPVVAVVAVAVVAMAMAAGFCGFGCGWLQPFPMWPRPPDAVNFNSFPWWLFNLTSDVQVHGD